ncbi:MAG: helix-turn-helix domain containing protein [Candidatus Pacebacteria bacterium]|nr:helix-turn-helix domain containing protein [Candidatus Paceibacterota bacterium]
MSRIKDREQAILLRKQGFSYGMIKQIIGVSKSTLSGWLKNYPLSEKRIELLRSHNQQQVERCRETKRRKKEDRLQTTYRNQKRRLLPLTAREFYLCGLFLYWGEGAKTHESTLSISNSDPAIVNFFIKWVTVALKMPREKIKIDLHLYKDMNIEKELNFWSEILNIPRNQFIRPYIKKSESTRINHKGSFGHGTCNARIGNARLTEQVLMGIKAITDKYRRV